MLSGSHPQPSAPQSKQYVAGNASPNRSTECATHRVEGLHALGLTLHGVVGGAGVNRLLRRQTIICGSGGSTRAGRRPRD